MAATRFRLAIGDQPESRPVPEPIKHGTLAVSGLWFRLRAPTERKAAIAASDMMKSTTMVISRKINIPYAITLKAESIDILRHETEVPGYKNIDIFRRYGFSDWNNSGLRGAIVSS